MANDGYIIRLQDQIGYEFTDIGILERALTAPGVEGNKEGDKEARDKYDGNRKLALLGDSILQLVVLYKSLYEDDADRSNANNAIKSAALKDHHEKRARFFQIDTHMKLSPRQNGRTSKTTLSLAVCAIFGACFRDSGSLSVVRTVIERFGIGANREDPERYVEPMTTLLQEQLAASQMVTGVFQDPSDNSSSYTAFSSPPVTINPSQEINGNASPRIAGLREIEERGVRISELSDSTIYSHWDTENADDECFWNITNHEQPSEMRWASTSASQNSLLESSANILSTSNNSSVELAMHDGVLQSVLGTPASEGDCSLQDLSEERPRLLQSHLRTTDTGYPLSTKRLNTSNTGTRIEKRKRLQSDRGTSATLAEYIILEKARCQSLGLPCPEESFNSAITQGSSNLTRPDEIITELKIFYFAIASPESLTALQAILKVHRRSLGGKLSMPDWRLSLAERMREIENLGKKIGYIAFLRRCHIYQLYVDCSAGSHKTSDGFINITTWSVLSRSNPQIGNPNNLEDSRVSKLIMKEIYPSLEMTSSEYKKKLRFFGKIRKLGQRLDLLVEKFGYGVLGLLPLATDVPAVVPFLNITDNSILKIPDDDFRWFVQCLDQLQGGLLRKASEATSEIVTVIFQGTLDPSKRFGIEQLEREEIIKYPKGSINILETISQAIPHTPMQPDLQHDDV